MSITKEMQDILQKNLPTMAADEMKKFIEQAQNDAKALKTATDYSDKQSEIIRQFQQKESKYEKAETLNQEAESKLAEAKKKEHELSLQIKDEQIKQRDYVISQSFSILALIAKNPRAIEIMSHYENQNQQPYSTSNGQWVYPQPINKTEIKTTESKETKNDFGLQPE